MTAEVSPEHTQMAESPVNVEEPLKQEETAGEENNLEASNGKNPSPDLIPEVDERRASFKEESNFLSDLKESERNALFELQSKLEEAIAQGNLLEKDSKEATDQEGRDANNKDYSIWGVPLLPSKGGKSTDVVLLKFLRAREFKVKDAFEMLKNTLRWRKENRVDSILDEVVLKDEFGKAGFINGIDREGHPVCYNVLGVFQDAEISRIVFGSEEGRKKFLRSRVQLMEQGIKELDMRPGAVSSMLHITDLKDMIGLSKKEVRDTLKLAVQLLQDNYPEFVARHVVINAPFWYYALNAILSPFLTQRTKNKFVVVRPAKVTETLLKYISAEAIPTHYGGLKRENDSEFSMEEGRVLELTVKPASFGTIEIPALETGTTVLWDFSVLGWEVNYRAEFVPADEGAYTVIVQKGKRIGAEEEPIRNSFRNNEPGKVILTIENSTVKKKRVFYRYKVTSA
ncbi:patellin-4 [Phalaenopsis equestris]|uniref:patellin-4 n=1 Tax=Phalaenopsis equestris TaxID=78828 RepID=UPI0009E5AB58|nr:patellin-4 [Phalaenopsis equestris]